MELADILLGVRLILFVRDTVDPGTGVLSKTPECLIQFRNCDQVSDRAELPFRIFLGEFSYSVDVCRHNLSEFSASLCFLSADSYACFPLPSSGFRGRLLREPCGSPPSSVLRGRKTAPASVRASSGRPSVARTSRPITRGGPPGVRGDGELSSVPGPSLLSMPWARDPGESARPHNNGRCQILPSATGNTSASRQDKISGLNPHGLLPCCLRFDTHQSPGEWQD